jgi:formylmethanofuran dehydrogenase subunit E
MKPFHELLISSAQAHGHLCPGQVVGVRMAMLGCRLIGLDDPRLPNQIKNLLVYVEIDRCAADAVAHVTGARLGRRSLKFMDYGIMAATFVNMETDKAFRVVSTEEARDLAPVYAPEVSGKARQQLLAYQRMPDSLLFTVERVDIRVSEFDLPGPTRAKAKCALCGQVVRDKREVVMEGMTLCRPCAHGAYWKNAQKVGWPDMDWTPEEASPLSPLDFQPHPAEIHKARNQEITRLKSPSFAGPPFDTCK